MKRYGFSHSIFNGLLLPLVILIVVAKIPALSAAEQTITDRFTRKVHAYKKVVEDGRGGWLSPASPWVPYTDRQYSEGLSDTLQKQYLAFQIKAQCEELMRLEKIGFSRLYPELSRALSDKIVKNIFTREIVPFHSFGAKRCRALAMLNPIMEKEKKLFPRNYHLTIPGTNLGNKPGKIYDPREIVLRKAFTILFDLAACEDYKPAINDILEYRKIYLIFVGYHGRYYFYMRAKHYGLETPDINQLVREIREFELSRRLQKIQYFLARGDLDAVRKLVFSLTYISCGRNEPE